MVLRFLIYWILERNENAYVISVEFGQAYLKKKTDDNNELCAFDAQKQYFDILCVVIRFFGNIEIFFGSDRVDSCDNDKRSDDTVFAFVYVR